MPRSPRRRHLAAATLVVALLLVASGCQAGAVGLVDSRRILAESAKALRYQKEIDDRERGMTTDLQLLAGRLSREDLEARRQQYMRELQTLRAELELALNKEVHATIQQLVKEKRLRGVIVKGAVIYNTPGRAVDITQDIIDRLK
jgi:Skp family chaperone for outer membrane proteins